MNFRSISLWTTVSMGALGCLSMAAGCELIAGVDRSLIQEGAGGTGGGTGGVAGMATTSTGMAGAGGTAGAGGMAGAGGGPICMGPGDCPPTGNECTAPTCTNGMCGTMNVAQGTPLMMQTMGDCLTAVCNGNGGIGSVPDNADTEDDNESCTTDTCNNGAPVHTPVAVDTPCMSTMFCSSMGTCVECNNGPQCPSGVCMNNMCLPASCMDMNQNGMETDVDCGGPVCMGCADGLMCLVNTDCQSAFCNPMTMICAAPTCMDTFQNGMETDVDCGGGVCPDCADGDSCLMDSDCTNGFCNPMTMVCATPTCMDGFMNGSETGIDCGGGVCPACANGQTCVLQGDCMSGMCYNNACVGSINGCDIATAMDLTGGAPTTVTFPNGNFTYAPKCIKVSMNTDVTFMGSFMNHPHEGGEVNMAGMLIPATSGPFIPVTNTGMSKVFTMNAVGTFPYYCQPHGAIGMNGAVFVVP